MYSEARRRTTNRAEARRVVGSGEFFSCGSREHRWRTKLYLGGRESLDDYHRSPTFGALPKIVRVLDA